MIAGNVQFQAKLWSGCAAFNALPGAWRQKLLLVPLPSCVQGGRGRPGALGTCGSGGFVSLAVSATALAVTPCEATALSLPGLE